MRNGRTPHPPTRGGGARTRRVIDKEKEASFERFPHVFETVAQAFLKAQQTKKSQSIIVTGASGSGKSYNTRTGGRTGPSHGRS